MSQPKRYTFVHIGRDVWMHEPDNRMEAAPAGEYVSASDYAALAAENERLRKAGDAVANLLGCMCLDDYYRLDDYYQEAVDAWNAAKEGRDAK